MNPELVDAVLANLARREEELIDCLVRLVATPSPNPPGDERAVVGFMTEAVESFGYGRIETPASQEHRPNLLASIGPRSRRSLVFSGHLDTKPAGNESEWATPPFEASILDGRIYGLGTADMKGAVAAMLFAGRALAEVGALGGELRLLLTADEEAGAALGATYLVDRIEMADGILVGEPTGIDRAWDYLAVASRGVACFNVVVRGTQLHSALTDRLPNVNASVKLAKCLIGFTERFRPEVPPGSPWRPTVNPGVILKGGVFYGVCPGHAEFGVDVRTVPGMTLSQLQADVEEFLEVLRGEDPELDVEVVWVPGMEWFPPSQIDASHPLLMAARSAVAATLGQEIPDDIFPGGTEGAIWATCGIPVLPALGPGRLTDAHRPNESVGVEEVIMASRIYALTALDFLSGEWEKPWEADGYLD